MKEYQTAFRSAKGNSVQQKATGPASGAFSQGRQANLSIESDFLVDGLAGRLKRLVVFLC